MGEKFEFVEQETAIRDWKELMRWQSWVKTQVRIGIELEKEGSSPLAELEQLLEPSHSYNVLSRYNVVNLVSDGSVAGDGHEILVTGTIEPFVTAYGKMEGLHKILREHNLRAGTSAGMHYHMLAAQMGTMPEVVLKNFYQLFRFYYAGILYLTSTTGRSPVGRGGITRSNDAHFFTPVHIGITPLGRTMADVKARVIGECGRYSAFNMGDGSYSRRDLMKFDASGRGVTEFHLELRFPDSSDSPAQIVAQMFLFRAMLMKAVSLSQFGVIRADDDRVRTTKNVVHHLQNGTCTPADIDYARDQAGTLIALMRPSILSIDGSSIGILEELVNKPVWQRRSETPVPSWVEIDAALLPRERKVSDASQVVLKAVELQEVLGAKTAQVWKAQAAAALGIPENLVRNGLLQIGRQGIRLEFDAKLGTYYVAW